MTNAIFHLLLTQQNIIKDVSNRISTRLQQMSPVLFINSILPKKPRTQSATCHVIIVSQPVTTGHIIPSTVFFEAQSVQSVKMYKLHNRNTCAHGQCVRSQGPIKP